MASIHINTNQNKSIYKKQIYTLLSEKRRIMLLLTKKDILKNYRINFIV